MPTLCPLLRCGSRWTPWHYEALQFYEPPPNTRCYVPRRGGEWFTGRTGIATVELRFLAIKAGSTLRRESVFLKSGLRSNPVELLALFGHDKPSRHRLRRAFVLSVLNQRKACRGLTALLPARIRLYARQVNVARRVLQDPVLRYVLADEVGLGKTIEAGLIAKQYLLDRPGRQLQIVSPNALEGQWQEELEGKIGMPPASFQVQNVEEFFSDPITIRPSLAILDEAHQLVAGANEFRTLHKRFEVLRSFCMRTESILLRVLPASVLPMMQSDKLISQQEDCSMNRDRAKLPEATAQLQQQLEQRSWPGSTG